MLSFTQFAVSSIHLGQLPSWSSIFTGLFRQYAYALCPRTPWPVERRTSEEINLPTLIGLMAAVGVLRSSGFLEEFGKLLGTVLEPAGIPSALVPLGVVRLFSNSAAVGLLLDLYKEAGCDSFAGRAASIMMSCTETVFYTMAVYFGAVHIKKTRYTLAGALLSSLVGMAVSIALAKGNLRIRHNILCHVYFRGSSHENRRDGYAHQVRRKSGSFLHSRAMACQDRRNRQDSLWR